MSDSNNSISINGHRNITVQGVDNSTITINNSNPEEFIKELKWLNGAHTLPKELTLNIPKIHSDDIIGREDDLKELHKLLSTEKRVVVVNGLGGIGKTTLAQVYLSKYYEEYEHIAWITQSSKNITVDFINEEALVKNLSIVTTGLEAEQIFNEVMRKLKSISNKPNLLIIDNGEQSLKSYRKMLPSQPLWHLLVTSREEIAGFYLITLGFLSEQQAIELFKKYYTLQNLDDQNIKELVQTVDYHTLTIEILAKTAKVQRYNAEELKVAIEQDLRANIEVPHNTGDGKIERVGSYLSSIFNLSKLSESEVWLLKQFICLPSDYYLYDILEELLVSKETYYKETFAETLSELAQKGWLLYNSSTDNYKVHRIIAQVVRRQVLITIADVKNLIIAISQKLGADNTKDNPVNKFVWMPFGKSLLAIFIEDTSSEIALLQNSLGLVLQDMGDYQEAKFLLEKAMRSDEKNLGEDHPNTAICYSNLGMLLQDLGDYLGAKRLLKKAVMSNEEHFGKDDPYTARKYATLGIVLLNMGGYQNLIEAKRFLEKAVRINDNHFGENHPDTARSYSNLALVLQKMGDYREAKELVEKAMVSNENHFDNNHPTTALHFSILAMILRDLGGHQNYQRAKALLEIAIMSDEKSFGKNHPTTAKRYYNLALVLQNLGEYIKSFEFAQKAFFILKKASLKDILFRYSE